MRAIKHRRGTYYRDYKKARGCKRHLKRLQVESITPAPMATDVLLDYEYYNEKLGLYPWHWHHRQPPKQVRQLAVQHLLTTFFDWKTTLAALPDPSYLAVWIVGPEFAHSSQVVAAMGEERDGYLNRFGTPNPAGPALPTEYRLLPGTEKLTWLPYAWHIYLDDYDYPDEWPDWALRHPHQVYQSDDESKYLAVQTGWIWIGTAPNV